MRLATCALGLVLLPLSAAPAIHHQSPGIILSGACQRRLPGACQAVSYSTRPFCTCGIMHAISSRLEGVAMTIQIARRPFTVTDYARMRETGILKEDDRVELIDGEVRLMSPI